ncbi:hypothetical protein MLD38_032220 [Melastoma candidum]|uniref:Uncharacterized protein n=1 Tax=Melastoma candidum TaxID=119954 RepID=A0ACB9M581_9MYRT|nr:hypothetical protein MLD38_032220 [Melastoma candidum]
MKERTNLRSKSVEDCSELLPHPHSPPHPGLPQLGSQPPTVKTVRNLEVLSEYDDCDGSGERFGVVLGLSSSVLSPAASAKKFTLDRKLKLGALSSSAEAKYSAMKRMFFVRRSVSVSESYCRIHDQSIEADCLDEEMGSPEKPDKQQQQHKGRKIIKACKRFFSLK